MDTATSDIRAVELTPSRDGDSPILPDLLDQIAKDEQIGPVTADGAYDTRGAIARSPRATRSRSFRFAKMVDCGRKTVRRYASATQACATRHYGRAFWKRWTGYHA